MKPESRPEVGGVCNTASIPSGTGYRYRRLSDEALKDPSIDTDCVGAYCIGCKGFPGTNKPQYPKQ